MNVSAIEAPQRMKHRHHPSRLARRVWQVVRVLAMVVSIAAVADFCYSAYLASDCFEASFDASGREVGPRPAIDTDECRAVITRRDVHMRLDAAALVVAMMTLIGASVMLSNARSSTKRMVLGIEAAMLVVVAAYCLLWMFSIR